MKAAFQLRMLFVLAAIMGALLLPFINLQLNPSPRVQKLTINFTYPGAGPVEVEGQVTSVLEGALSRLEHLTEITSSSSIGRGDLRLAFSKDADMTDVRLNVSVLIRQVYPGLPQGVSYPEISYESNFESKSPLLSYAIASDLPGSELEQIIRQKLMIPLGRIPGVANTTLQGLQRDECQITYDPYLLATLGIDEEALATSIRQWNNRLYLGSQITSDDRSAAIHLVSGPTSVPHLRSLQKVPVGMAGGRTLALAELASINISPEREQQYFRINGQRSTNLTIYTEDQVNFIRLAAQCRQEIAELRQALPESVDLILQSDRSAYLEKELRTIGIRMLVAMLILLLSMMIIYRHAFKIFAVWSGFIISLLSSVVIYFLAGLELHLYSLAGLTLSLGIVLDNLIVSTDHIYKYRNQKIFVALLAATLTTIGALSIIFFISPEYREQLTDFAWIFIINVSVSLLVASLYLPAIIGRHDTKKRSSARRRNLVRFNRAYAKLCSGLSRHRWIPIGVLLLTFGIPFFLLPTDLESENKWAKRYDALMDGWYGTHLHGSLSKYLGGTFRLFHRSKDQFFFGQTVKEETRLFVRASVPFGGTTAQLDNIVRDFEQYLNAFPEVKQTTSYVSGPHNSFIEISFHELHADGAFPYRLKSLLESKAVETGSGDFQIYGVGRGFDNELRGEGLSTHLKLLGYNYDQLQEVALQASEKLLRHMRIQKVYINPTRNHFAPDDRFFQLDLDEDFFMTDSRQHRQAYLQHWQGLDPDKGLVGTMQFEHQSLPIRLLSTLSESNDIWHAQHTLHQIDTHQYLKPVDRNQLVVRRGENKIVRYNQQYQLYLEYDFIGNFRLGQKVKEQALAEIRAQMPPGYHISDDDTGWWWRDSQEKMAYIVLASLLVIVLISAILFNSIKQALIPLLLVPVAFIGIFLTVHFFEFRFDQGGFAAFLLVAGLSVNAGIFIINDFNNIRKQRNLTPIKAYIKAYHAKILPILLTILSTILGLLPFLLLGKNEPFWYPLAICTIAGLVFSVIGVVLLPAAIKS